MFKQLTYFKITFLYAIFAALWIIASDQWLMITFDNIFLLGYVAQAKGLFFVAITSTFLYFLLKSWYISLQQSIESSHLLMQSALDAVVSMDKDGNIMAWNSQAESIFGYSQAEAIGCQVAELIVPPVYRNAHREGIRRFVETGVSTMLETHVETEGIRADGSIFPIELTVVRQMQNNQHFFTAYIRDLTERKKAEALLRESEEKFRLFIRYSPSAIAMFDREMRYLAYSHRWITDYRLNEKELIGRSHYDVFPEITERVKELHQRSLAGAVERCAEAPFPRADGTVDWVSWEMHPWLTSERNIGGVIIFSEVITERKLAENELRIAATAFESNEAMLITDAQQIILKVNQAFTRITGYSAEEAIGNKPSILKSDKQDKQFYDRMWESLNHDKFWLGEIWNRRKNGELYPEWISISAVTDKYGQISNYVAAFTDITAIKESQETIHNLAYYDPLTNLPNRRFMLERLKQTLMFHSTKNQHSAILFVNLNNFRILNDSKGHAMGDSLLLAVTSHLQAIVHADDTVARIGSDEFVVLLDKLNKETNLAAIQAEEIAKRVLFSINQPFDLQGYEYQCSASIGITLFCDSDVAADELIRQAEIAMHQAKERESNTISFFDPAIQLELESRVQLETWMRKALNDQYRLYYQIQVDENGKAIGAETLIRWHHPEQGIISPADFIPLAEKTDLILSIGQWVLETVCSQLKAWGNDPNTQHLILAVNVSAKQFRQSDFVASVLAVLEKTGANPCKLKLELTESMLVDDIEDIIVKMQALRNEGVKFSLDDFGTGFSSLAYLKRLPLNQLKIDQSFVREARTNYRDTAIIHAIIALGHSLDMDVIAEGVETEEDRKFLATHGCNNYQGYFFSKPIPIDMFEKLLHDRF
ncbi:MAG: EAL domain-containing protein [Methylococcales bacterium]|nr:EAL domain-containing protein [Methylococcales bacterium]